MSKPFLRQVAEYIYEQHKDTMDSLCIVLPGKRASLFLKRHLAECFGKTIWAPKIITAEELVGELSGLQVAEEIDLICLLYESYKACQDTETETFESFARWGNLILQDFNEIDRYLADSEALYENLKDIKVIENWSLGEEVLTLHQQNYLKFMASIGGIYKHYSKTLREIGIAYQGLSYREAVGKLEDAPFIEQFDQFLFCGFNALNESELKIGKHLQKKRKAKFLWDADRYYLDDENQEAGLFLRKNFQIFQEKEAQFISEDFNEEKDITVITVPGQTGQAQVVRQTLENLIQQEIPMDRVALVLANEKLLWPVLQQLPAEIEHVNITMEYPLRYTSSYSLIELILNLQIAFQRQQRTKKQIYYSDLISLLRHPLLQQYFTAIASKTNSSSVIAQIKRRNLSFIQKQQMQELFAEDYAALSFLFEECSVANFIQTTLSLLDKLLVYLSENAHSAQGKMEMEFLQLLIKNFNRLTEIIIKYQQYSEWPNFRQLFQQSIGTASAPFIGEPLKGLQIMGVLETRTLDFDYLILVNVNEGILPAGKTISSFIPNDLKRAFGLPLYLEKDAIYAYHFYRLLQRSKQIVITCDSVTDSFGKGEKSRFVTQLQLELSRKPNIQLREEIAIYPEFEQALDKTIRVKKTGMVLEPVIKKATSDDDFGGLSPSGLISHKECPLGFYFRYSAGLKEALQVEESAEAGTFGSLLHLSLENLYKSFLEKPIDSKELEKKIKLIGQEVEESFGASFGNRINSGKLALQQEVIKVYVEKLIKQDLHFIKELEVQKKELMLLGLEKELSAELMVNINGKTEKIYIKGKIDRLDKYANTIRIIDYKSSVKDNDKFTFDGIAPLFTDVRYNKQLQLFMYAWLLSQNNIASTEDLRPCIIPFKKFTEEPLFIMKAKDEVLQFTRDLLEEFGSALSSYVSGIFDQDLDFIQTDNDDLHEYCPYNSLCQLK